MPYEVYDLRDKGWTRKKYDTRIKAHRAAERKNLNYGAHRYTVITVDERGNRVPSII